MVTRNGLLCGLVISKQFASSLVEIRSDLTLKLMELGDICKLHLDRSFLTTS